MYLPSVLELAILAAAAALPLTALIWQAGKLRRRILWVQMHSDARRESQVAESKRWEDAVAAVDSKLAPLTKQLADFSTRLSRIEENRRVIELTKVGT